MQLTGLDLPASDPERQERFYADLLGPLARALRFMAAGAPGTLHLAFEVPEDRLAESLASVRRRARIIEAGVELPAGWDAHAFYFADPEGNVLEAIARHRLPTAAAAAPFLRISEVGLPVEDVRATVDWLAATLDAPLFDGGGPGFAAVGDEQGLLIAVPRGRRWFPTDRVPAGGPLEVRLAGGPPGIWEVPGGGGVRIARGGGGGGPVPGGGP